MKCKNCCQGIRKEYKPELRQSGCENPKSYICWRCDTFHDDKGEPFDKDKDYTGKKTFGRTFEPTEETCTKCGSTDVVFFIYGHICNNCGNIF